jgi:hypothetical protein
MSGQLADCRTMIIALSHAKSQRRLCSNSDIMPGKPQNSMLIRSATGMLMCTILHVKIVEGAGTG